MNKRLAGLIATVGTLVVTASAHAAVGAPVMLDSVARVEAVQPGEPQVMTVQYYRHYHRHDFNPHYYRHDHYHHHYYHRGIGIGPVIIR